MFATDKEDNNTLLLLGLILSLFLIETNCWWEEEAEEKPGLLWQFLWSSASGPPTNQQKSLQEPHCWVLLWVFRDICLLRTKPGPLGPSNSGTEGSGHHWYIRGILLWVQPQEFGLWYCRQSILIPRMQSQLFFRPSGHHIRTRFSPQLLSKSNTWNQL